MLRTFFSLIIHEFLLLPGKDIINGLTSCGVQKNSSSKKNISGNIIILFNRFWFWFQSSSQQHTVSELPIPISTEIYNKKKELSQQLQVLKNLLIIVEIKVVKT